MEKVGVYRTQAVMDEAVEEIQTLCARILKRSRSRIPARVLTPRCLQIMELENLLDLSLVTAAECGESARRAAGPTPVRTIRSETTITG